MPFAPVHFTTGPVVVSFAGYQLGYCEDGVQVAIQPRYDDIYSDDMGGRAGVPSDSQLLGATADLQLLFTKYQKQYLDNLSSFRSGALTSNAKGVLPPIGSFVRQDGLYSSLVLAGLNETLTFATAHPRRSLEINSGTRARRYVCGFEAWLNQTDYTQIATAQYRTLFTMA